MARSRKSDPEHALQAAISMFWKSGYAAVGTRQIEDEAGITRFTLQTSYGGKMALFLMAVDRYLDMFETVAPPVEPDTLDALADWFTFFLAPPVMPECMAYGCFLLNTLIEFGGASSEVNQRASRYYRLLGGRFELALEHLKRLGQLPGDFDVRQGAQLLQSSTIGMNVLIRAANSSEAGRPSIDACRSMIHGWARS